MGLFRLVAEDWSPPGFAAKSIACCFIDCFWQRVDHCVERNDYPMNVIRIDDATFVGVEGR